MSPRPDATLADLAMQETFKKKMPGVSPFIRDWIKTSHKFTIHDEMVDLMVHSSMNLDKLSTRFWLARLPFDRVWIEMDGHRLVHAIRKFSRDGGQNMADVPKRLGFLLMKDPARETRFIIYPILGASEAQPDQHLAVLSPMVYFVDCEEPISESYSLFGCKTLPELYRLNDEFSEDHKRAKFYCRAIPLGLTGHFRAQDILGYVSKVAGAALPEMCRLIEECKTDTEYHRLTNGLMQCAREDSGIVRQLVTLLAMLNTVPMIEKRVEGSGYRPIGMNRVRYMDYSTITLKLPKKNPIIYMERYLRNAAREQETRRRHTVRTHWREMRKSGDYACQHDFRNVEGNRYECKCGRIGWWIKQHDRGDASKGWVQSNYEVTAS